jgi:hypothetical protein
MEQLGGFLHAVAREAPVPQYDIATTQQLILCYFRDMALYHGLARELPGPPEQTGESAQGLEPASNAVKTGGPQKSRIDGIRIAAQSVPLWRSVRGFIPLRVKQRVAAWLSRMEEHS